MPTPINKTLQGVTRLTEGGVYQFQLPTNSRGIQNEDGRFNVANCYIIVEETVGDDPFLLYLPSISTFNGGWNVNIFIVNKNERVLAITPRVGESGQDFINFEGSQTVEIKSINMFKIVDNNLWASWTALN